MRAQLEKPMLDCPDPRALASFYAALLDMRVLEDEPDWVVLGREKGMRELAFQRAEPWIAPDWPDPARPQQVHLDVRVDDVAEAAAYALSIGAQPAPTEPGDGFLVMLDPAGHPFCLVHGPSRIPDPRMAWDTTV